MKTSLKNFREQLLERLLDLAWRQWTALGVAGSSNIQESAAIDPEALVLFTTSIGRYDARLFDEVLDWLQSNGSLINLQRLKNLWKSSGEAVDIKVLSAIASRQGDRAILQKWKGLGAYTSCDLQPTPLFQQQDGTALPFFGEADSSFEKFGLLRGRVELRGMSRSPDPHLRSNLLMKLRALIGVNARSEILLYLLTHTSGHPGEIARASGYFRKTVQDALNAMELSGHVHSHRHGREKHFWINADEWQFLISWPDPKTFPVWVEWQAWFALLSRILASLTVETGSETSPLVHASRLRKVIEGFPQPPDVFRQVERSLSLSGEAFLEALCSALMQFLTGKL